MKRLKALFPATWLILLGLGSGCQNPTPNESSPSPSVDSTQTTGSKAEPAKPAADEPTSKDVRSTTDTVAKDDKTAESTLFHWAFSKDEGLKQAKSEHKYVVLKFEASWCGPCQIMKREAFEDKNVADILRKAIIVPIDVDSPEGGKLSAEFKADTIPRLEFLKPDGKSFGHIVGYAGLDWLKKNLKQIVAKA